jgi:demethylmenaquinone methyltransferase/2-methoxy-6-polyprenyl-1,4-benzoquinol methylase
MPDTSSKPLHGMFTAVPPRYDLVNRIITWGFDRRWREAAARTCLASSPKRVLDLGCGTGDLTIAIARLAGEVEIVGLDYSQPMLEIARRKAKGLKVAFVNGDAANLAFPDNYFDCVGISFAFRNLTYRNPLTQRALSEVLRVLKPGGRFVIVESSQPKSRLIRWLFHLYLRWYVFSVGYLLSGNRGAYQYLAESSVRFYTPEEVKGLLLNAGFRRVSYRPLLFGVAGIHVAVR